MRLILGVMCFVGLVSAWSGNTDYRWRIKCEWVWGCRYKTWSACCSWGWISVEVRYKEYFCLTGWTHNGNQNCNIAICPYDCGGSRGSCISPGVCRCNPGYTGTYCVDVAACSHLTPCYPGYCTSNACMCTNNFFPENSGTSNCLNFPTDQDYYPSIEQSTLDLGYYHQVKGMLIYNMTIDSAMSPDNVETFWTNRRDANRMNFTLQSIFSPSTLNLPSRPDYIIQYDLGITEADVKVVVTNSQNQQKFTKTLRCTGVNRDSPVNEHLYCCDTHIDYFDIRFDSGDTYSVTFRAENGGYRIVNNVGKQYYVGKPSTRRIDLKFDTETPYHCSEKSNVACNSSSSTMMTIQNDVTKSPIQISWKGWKDELSKVARYALEVFKLVKAGDGTLKEPYTDLVPNPVPLNITEFLETTEEGEHSFTYQPSEPGVYSWILEINDKANNSAYVRRFVIYDPISSVTSDESHPFYATSGNSIANYKWQNTNPKTFSFSWKNHFLNKIHENGNFLARIRWFPPSLDDGGDRNGYKRIPDKYDDTKGTRSRDAITNERGILKYDVAYNIGRDQPSPPTFQYLNYKNSSIEILENQNLQDGHSFTIWVKAYDILGNTKEERFVLHYDSSKPAVSSAELRENVGEDKMNFTSSVHILGASDPHSGVRRIKYRFRAQSTNTVVGDKEYEYLNPSRDGSYCNRNPCDSNLPTGESFGKTIDLPFSNCYAMDVSDVSMETVTMEMDVYNSAGLFISISLQISNLTSLRGVNDYFGPMKIRIAEQIGQTLKIMWDQAPSCYNIQGFEFIYSKAEGKVVKSEMFHEVQNWVILNDVEENTEYQLRLHTLYGNDPNNPIRSVASNFTFLIPEQPPTENKGGQIAGGVSGAFLIIIIFTMHSFV